jgi:pimeloyl-ACP methyl ester carboxylesterase
VATLLLIAVVALLLLAAVYRWQDRLLYFPDRAPLAQLAAGGLRPWPSVLAGFAHPVVVAVAQRDRIVPARLGHALHAALGGRKQLLVIPDSDHNDWPDRVDAPWWRMATAAALGEHEP